MKTIKTISAVFILFVSSINFAQAQRGGQQGPPSIPNNKEITTMVSELADNISLSDEQEVKILALYKAHFAKVKEKTSGNSHPKREDMMALQTALEKNVNAELTKEQISKYEAYRKKQSKQRPQRR